MTKQAHTVSDPSSRALKLRSSELPLPDAAQHDERLLDEALAETSPASDTMAVSLLHPLRTSVH